MREEEATYELKIIAENIIMELPERYGGARERVEGLIGVELILGEEVTREYKRI